MQHSLNLVNIFKKLIKKLNIAYIFKIYGD